MRRLIMFLLLIFIVFAIALFFILRSQTASAKLLNFITPSSTYTLEKNFVFGSTERDRIDFYFAKDSYKNGDETRPIIVFIHGGGWREGDKNMYKFLAEGLTREGFDVAMPNYRLYPEVIYPEFLKDNASAIAAVNKRFPERYMVLVGHSAGAYNAMGMVFKPEYLQEEGIEPCYAIKGVVSLAGPTGFLPAEKEPTTTIFPEKLQGSDSFYRGPDVDVPPLFLINGDKDTSVLPENSIKMGEKLGANVAKVKIYEGMTHADPVVHFSSYGFLEGPTKADVIDFINALPDDEGDGFCR